MQCLVADEDRKQRGGADALGRGGAAACGHLDEGVGPALGRGAGQLVDPRRVAQALLGLGTVGLEEVVLEAVELAWPRWSPRWGRGSSGPATCRPGSISKNTLRAALRSSSEASAPSGSASCFQ